MKIKYFLNELMISDRKIPYVIHKDVDLDMDPEDVCFDNPEKVYKLFKLLGLTKKGSEEIWVLYFDNAMQFIGMSMLSRGSIDKTIASPRELIQTALLSGAVNIIMTHNHPSGNPEPSDYDIALTQRMKKAMDICGLNFIEHIICGDDKYYSFAEKEML